MKCKSLLVLSALVASCAAFAGDYFVSNQGGLWSKASTWRGNALPQEPVNLRMDAQSGNLEIDGDRKIANASVWGKPQNIHILDGSKLTVGAQGFNVQAVPVCVSGSGFMHCGGNSLVCYGGNGGRLNFVGNLVADKIIFTNDRKLLKKATMRMMQPIDRVFKTSVNAQGVYSDLVIRGAANASTRVEFLGNMTVGDIDISSNAHVFFKTSRLFMSGKYKKIEVSNSVLELSRSGAQYGISSKVRLNGGASLVLNGDPYYNFVNVIFNAGKTNTVKIGGFARLKGFCIYSNGAGARTLKIVLPKNAKQCALHLESIVFNPGSKMCLKADSLSKDGSGADVADISIAIENFANGAVKIDRGFANGADYAKITASGWKNFRLENGFLTADKAK